MFRRKARSSKRQGESDSRPITTEDLKNILSCNADIAFNEICISRSKGLYLPYVFVTGMVNTKTVNDDILKPLVENDLTQLAATESELAELILAGNIYHCQRRLCKTLQDCTDALMSGSLLLIFDGPGCAISFESEGYEKRSLTEPTNENVLKGSKEAFIEVIRVNTAIIRRRIKTQDLKIEEFTLGERTKTHLVVTYIAGIANSKTVEEVKRRLQKVKLDGIVAAGQIESLLMDTRWTVFPQVIYTERVDKFCGSILEGRVGILIDGMPMAYIVPVDINTFLQAPEDYSIIFPQSSLFRLLRYICAIAALILPAFYVSVTSFHQEMIPTDLAVSIIQSKQGVPFPTFIEVILMLFAFEILLEAGLRLPKAVGQAVSIVGALVVGEAAITAKLLSPGVVIIIATAGISGFVIPSQDMSNALRICRFFLVFSSLIGGLYGVSIGLILIGYHLSTMEVFEVPYLSPLVSSPAKAALHDTLFRMPWANAHTRPQNISPEDTERQG